MPNRLQPHVHIGQLELHRLVLDDDLTALEAVPGVLDCVLVGRLRDSYQVPGKLDIVEPRAPLRPGTPSLVHFQQAIGVGDAAVIEDEFGVLVETPADFVVPASDAEARCVLLHQEQSGSLLKWCLGIGAGVH